MNGLMTGFTERIMRMASAPPGAKPKAVRVPWDMPTYTEKIDYKGMNIYWAEYRRASLIRQCINLLAYFAVHTGYRINVRGGMSRDNVRLSKYLNKLDEDINIENAIYVGLIGKKVWGRFGFEIVRDNNDKIVQLLPLFPPEKLVPKFTEDNILKGFEFQPKGSVQKISYKPEEVLYFVDSSIDNNMMGLSSIEPILTSCDIKRELFSDLREAAKRLWAPIGIFSLDTSACNDAKEVEKAINDFRNQIEPGKPVVINQSMEGTFFNAMPDVERISRAIEKVDEEIMGNFGIPKALLARERTMNRATLEYSLQALYQSQIEGLQQYFSSEIQSQLLHLVRDEQLGDAGKTVTCELIWNPRTSLDLDRQFGPVIKLYAMGLIDEDYLFDLLCLDKNRMPVFKTVEEKTPEGTVMRRSVPIARYDADTLRAVLSERSVRDTEDINQDIDNVLDSAKGEV